MKLKFSKTEKLFFLKAIPTSISNSLNWPEKLNKTFKTNFDEALIRNVSKS
jgi:hypothetical protein